MSGPPETFTLGLVLGPGGNARETYLREKFGFDSRNDDAIRWRPDMAVVSGIAGLEAAPDGERAAVSACKRLGACGLSSVPSWLRPYECLSNGEAARVDVAAALAAHQGGGAGAYCVVDDFACVVNRDAARSMSCAVGKYVRKLGVRNVVLATSHADVCAYLQPDWVYDVTSQTYTARPTATAAPPKISIECDWSELDKVPAPQRQVHAERGLWRELQRTYELADGAMAEVVLGDGALPAPCSARVRVDGAVESASRAFDFAFEGLSSFTPPDFPAERLPKKWRLGVIHGPSGSGKTTVLRSLFGGGASGKVATKPPPWAGETKTALETLFADAFGAEDGNARLDMACLGAADRAAAPADLPACASSRALAAWNVASGAVLDEFTSLAERPLARRLAANLATYVEKRKLEEVVVATVHEDVIAPCHASWLFCTAVVTSCWAVDPGQPKKGASPNGLSRNGCLVLFDEKRAKWRPSAEDEESRDLFGAPDVRLNLQRCNYWEFEPFKKHHYLSETISGSAKCWLLRWNGRPIAFHSMLYAYGLPGAGSGSTGAYREHRVVVLPDFQGIGLGWMLSEVVASHVVSKGTRVMSITMHPTFGGMRDWSERWRPKKRNHQADRHQATYNARERKEADWAPTDRARLRPSFRHEYVGAPGADREKLLENASTLVPDHVCKPSGCAHCTSNRLEVEKVIRFHDLTKHEIAGTCWECDDGPPPVVSRLPEVVDVTDAPNKSAAKARRNDDVKVTGGRGPWLHAGKMIDGRVARGTKTKGGKRVKKAGDDTSSAAASDAASVAASDAPSAAASAAPSAASITPSEAANAWSFDAATQKWVPTAEDADFRVTGAPCGVRVRHPQDARDGTIVGVGEVEDEAGALAPAYRVVYDTGAQGDLYEDEFRAARLKHEAKAKALAQRAVAAAAESGNFRDVADLFVGATFADGDTRGAAERKGKSGAGGGVDVAWDDGTSAHLKWADAANRAVALKALDAPAVPNARRDVSLVERIAAPEPPAKKAKKAKAAPKAPKAKAASAPPAAPPRAKKPRAATLPLPPLEDLPTKGSVSAPPAPAPGEPFDVGDRVDARFGRNWYGGVVDEVIWKVTEGDEAHVRAYEVMWANGDCNRIAVTHVRHPVPGTPAG